MAKGAGHTRGGDASKASRLRKAEILSPIDRLWLQDYDERLAQRARARRLESTDPPAAAATKDQGRSRSGRKIHFQLEEAAEAEGTGTAAAAAAAAAMQAKEEGRRLDALTVNAIEGYRQLVKDQREWLQEIRRNERAAQRRVERYEQTHVALIDTVRESLLARVNSEIELVKTLAEREDQDPAAGILGAILEKNGFKLPGSKGPPNGSHGDK